jgi:hypothetical protein
MVFECWAAREHAIATNAETQAKMVHYIGHILIPVKWNSITGIADSLEHDNAETQVNIVQHKGCNLSP